MSCVPIRISCEIHILEVVTCTVLQWSPLHLSQPRLRLHWHLVQPVSILHLNNLNARSLLFYILGFLMVLPKKILCATLKFHFAYVAVFYILVGATLICWVINIELQILIVAQIVCKRVVIVIVIKFCDNPIQLLYKGRWWYTEVQYPYK